MSNTSPVNQTNFHLVKFLGFVVSALIQRRKQVSMHLFVSQLICTSIHQPTANYVSCYIMTSFHSRLIPDSFHSRTIFLYSYQYQMQQEHLYKICSDKKRQSVEQTKLYPILKTIIHFIHLSVSERYNSCYKTAGIKSNFIRKVSSCTIIGLLFISNSIIVQLSDTARMQHIDNNMNQQTDRQTD